MLEDDPLIDEPPQPEEIRGSQPENLASRSLDNDSLIILLLVSLPVDGMYHVGY